MLLHYKEITQLMFVKYIWQKWGETSVPVQAKELRQKALSYRRRAWGTNFSRDHLNQLQSEHNALWEPTDTTNSATDTPTPRLTFDLCQDPDSCSTSCVEALDLARWETQWVEYNHHHRSENSSELISLSGCFVCSRSSHSSKRSSVVGPGEIHNTNKSTQTKAQMKAQPPPSHPAERRTAWEEEKEEEEKEEENTDE